MAASKYALLLILIIHIFISPSFYALEEDIPTPLEEIPPSSYDRTPTSTPYGYDDGAPIPANYPKSSFGSVTRTSTNTRYNILNDTPKEFLKSFIDQTIKQMMQQLVNISFSRNPEGLPISSSIFHVSFGIGTPVQNISGVMDISSSLIWTQCKLCDKCINQSTTLYDPKLSSTFSNFSSLNCNSTDTFSNSSVCQIIDQNSCPGGCPYTTTYSISENSTGYVGTDTFTYGSSSAPRIYFGCGTNNYGNYDDTSGIMALGKGPLSLVSQLKYKRFSYCLSSSPDQSSSVSFGPLATLEGSGQSTPLIANNNFTNLYYINLVDITVGNTRLNIPNSTFSMQNNGTGGVFLATTVPVTFFEKAGYDLVKQAFASQIKSQTVDGSYLGLDLCFQKVNKLWPSLTLHFAGNVNLTLNSFNYMVKDPNNGIECLTILPSQGVSVLGTFIQMDTHFVYDIENSTILFEQIQCSASCVISVLHHTNFVTIALLAMFILF